MSKGFTLIELLAVIVILAVLMLMATPAVLNIMNNARKNAFKTEALSIIDAAKTYYAANAVTTTSGSDDDKTIYCVGQYYTSTSVTTGSDCALNSYIDKDLSDYVGYVVISYNASTKKTSYSITLSNGTYSIGSPDSDVSSATDATEAAIENSVQATESDSWTINTTTGVSKIIAKQDTDGNLAGSITSVSVSSFE